MAATELTFEKIIEHHLTQNLGQKITPHLVAGLVILMSQNIRTSGVITQAMGLKPVKPENEHD